MIAGPRLRKMPTVGKGNRQPKVFGQCGMSISLRAYSLRAPATRFWRVRVRAPELVRSGGTNCSFRRGRSQFGYACLATEPEPALHQTREGLRARCGGRSSCRTVGAINGRLRHNYVLNTKGFRLDSQQHHVVERRKRPDEPSIPVDWSPACYLLIYMNGGLCRT
jgi:hypothetical protein